MNGEWRLGIDDFPGELRLMLALLGHEHHAAAMRRIMEESEPIDWDRFLEFVMHHRVYPLIYQRLKQLDIGTVPDTVLDALHREYRLNTFKMLHLAAELERICRTFQEAHIRVLVLKGPALAEALYGELSMRTSKDLDLLISIDDLESAEKVMSELGYEPRHNLPRIFNDWKWRAHHISFNHRLLGIQVEIHWKMHPNFGKEPRFSELWSRKLTVGREKGSLHCLSREDLALYLIVHGARHAWFRIRWIIDVCRLMDTVSAASWHDIRKLSEQLRVTPMVGQYLVLASELLQQLLHHDQQELASSRSSRQAAQRAIMFIRHIVRLNPEPETRELKKSYRRYLMSLRSNRQKLWHYLSSLYPSSYDVEYFPMPRYLYFMYVPLRPCLWLWRTINGRNVKQNGANP